MLVLKIIKYRVVLLVVAATQVKAIWLKLKYRTATYLFSDINLLLSGSIAPHMRSRYGAHLQQHGAHKHYAQDETMNGCSIFSVAEQNRSLGYYLCKDKKLNIMFPTSVYAELTPNPNTMKFVADRVIFNAHDAVEYLSGADAKGSSELATQLFNFPFVKSVFIARSFVTIGKTGDLSWDMITFELREFIREFLLIKEFVVENLPVKVYGDQHAANENRKPIIPAEPSEYDEAIVRLLDEYVKPAVESDGGAIDFVSFKDGVVTVQLRGSCSGCPSSTMTLKSGIETLLTTELPVVKEVVAESV